MELETHLFRHEAGRFVAILTRIFGMHNLAPVLRYICGFGVAETAAAFLKNPAAMEKRLIRAEKTLSRSRDLFDLPGGADVAARLSAVLHAIYLLFNEGYHGASSESPVRTELCTEALRLASLLLENPLTATPTAHALAALMQFHAARLPGRMDDAGNLILLIDQDRSRWDQALIAEGRRQLERSADGNSLTAYHVEAAIAQLHADAPSAAETDWNGIASLYETLMHLAPSPIVALNRAVAVAQRDGPAQALAEIERIKDRQRLLKYPFYFSTLGEFELRCGRKGTARKHFASALMLARNPAERRFLEERLRTAE